VGVNTLVPTHHFDVSGSARITKDLTVNGNLYINGIVDDVKTKIDEIDDKIQYITTTTRNTIISSELEINNGNIVTTVDGFGTDWYHTFQNDALYNPILPFRGHLKYTTPPMGYSYYTNELDLRVYCEGARNCSTFLHLKNPTLLDVEIYRVTSGKMGVNTEDPEYTFDISGDIRSTGDAILEGEVEMGGNVTVGGWMDISGNVDIGGGVDISGNVDIGGGVNIGAGVDISGGVVIGGNTSIWGNVMIDESVFIDQSLNVIGDISGFHIHANSTISNPGFISCAGIESIVTMNSIFSSTVSCVQITVHPYCKSQIYYSTSFGSYIERDEGLRVDGMSGFDYTLGTYNLYFGQGLTIMIKKNDVNWLSFSPTRSTITKTYTLTEYFKLRQYFWSITIDFAPDYSQTEDEYKIYIYQSGEQNDLFECNSTVATRWQDGSGSVIFHQIDGNGHVDLNDEVVWKAATITPQIELADSTLIERNGSSIEANDGYFYSIKVSDEIWCGTKNIHDAIRSLEDVTVNLNRNTLTEALEMNEDLYMTQSLNMTASTATMTVKDDSDNDIVVPTKKMSYMKNVSSDLQGQIDSKTSELVTTNTNVSSLQSKYTSMYGNVYNLQSNYTSIYGNVTTLQSNYSSLYGNTISLQLNYSSLYGNTISLQSNYSSIYGNVTTLQSNYSSIYGNVTTLQSNYSSLYGNTISLQSNYTSMYGNVTLLQEKTTDITYLSTEDLTIITGNVIVDETLSLNKISYQYPPKQNISDTATSLVNNESYGNGTYNLTSAITYIQDGDFTIYPVDTGRPSFNAYSSNAWSGNSAHGESGDGINFIDPFPSGIDCATFYASQTLQQNTYLYAGDYNISFWITKRKEGGYITLNPIKLTINGVELGTSTPASTAVWTQFTYAFNIPTSGLINILFNSLNTTTACTGLDNIVITPTSVTNPASRAFNREGLEWYVNKNSRNMTTVDAVNIEGDWTQIEMPKAIKLHYYSFYQVSASESPTAWILGGSNNGLSWTAIDNVTGHTPIALTTYYKQINTETTYSYYRFIVISQTGGSGIQCRVSKLSLYSKTTELSYLDSITNNLYGNVCIAQGNITTLTSSMNSIYGNLTVAQGNITTLTSSMNSIYGNLTVAQGNITTLTTAINGVTYTSATNTTQIENNVNISTDKSFVITNGSATINSNSTSMSKTQGTLILSHSGNTDSTGQSCIIFPSSKSGEAGDYGYIQYKDDFLGETGKERSVLIIGVENDEGSVHRDRIALYPCAGTGFVGINTLDPQYDLDIYGTMRISGTMYIDYNVSVGGVTLTPTELSHLDGVSSNIQTQIGTINSNISLISGNITTLQTKTTSLSYNTSVTSISNIIESSGVIINEELVLRNTDNTVSLIITEKTNLVSNGMFDVKSVTTYTINNSGLVSYTNMTQAEKDITKWYSDGSYFIGNTSSAYAMTTPYPSSTQILILQKTAQAWQNIYMYIGTYQLSMYISRRPGYNNPSPIEIYTDLSLVTTFSPSSSSWQYVSVSFGVTTEGLKKLHLKGTESVIDVTCGIDNVDLIRTSFNTLNHDELYYLKSCTSNIQTQLNSITSNLTGITHSSDVTTVDNSLTLSSGKNLTITSGSIIVGATTITSTEIGYLDGVTSSVQTQLNTISTTLTGLSYNSGSDTTNIDNNLSCISLTISSGNLVMGSTTISPTEIGYLDGVTSSIQTQFNNVSGNVTTLQTKMTGMAYSSSITTINGEIDISNNITRTSTNASMVFKHASIASGGTGYSTILFPSSTNAGEYGYIEYRDNHDNATSGEKGLMIFGIENDPTNINFYDRISIYTPAGGGFVGINTLTPSYSLDITGNMRLTGTGTMAALSVSGTASVTSIVVSYELSTPTITGNVSMTGNVSVTSTTTTGRLVVSGISSTTNTIAGDTDFNELNISDNVNFNIDTVFNSGVYIQDSFYPSTGIISTSQTIYTPYKQIYIMTASSITVTLGNNGVQDGVMVTFRKTTSGTNTIKISSGVLNASNSFSNVGPSPGNNLGVTFTYSIILVYYSSGWYAIYHS
jgi:hypothetical protein